jgi:type IV secretion system protein TrbL
MVRKLLIIVAAVFAPLAFAGATSDISTSWVRKWIETMVALVISKLILVIIFVIGLGVLTDGLGEVNGKVKGAGASATQSITQTIIGALILLMAGFAPWLAIKLVHFGGEHFGQIHGHARSALAGAQTVAAAPRKVQSLAGGFAGVRAGGSTASAGARIAPDGLRAWPPPPASRAPLGLPRPGRSVPLGPWLAWPAPPRRRSTKGPAPLPTCRQGSLRAPRHRHRRHRQPSHGQPSPKGRHRPVGDISVSASGRSVGRKECSHAGVRRAP